jgi:hypothetical protein
MMLEGLVSKRRDVIGLAHHAIGSRSKIPNRPR